MHTVGRLVLDPIPECLELLAVENRLPGLHRPPFIGILDVQLPGQLPEHLLDLRELSLELLWQA